MAQYVPAAATCTATYSSPEDFYKATICVTEKHAKEIEEETRSQSSCQAWFIERREQVTSTLCKSIVCRRKVDFTSIIRYVARSVGMLPLAMVWTVNLWQLPTIHVNARNVRLTLL